MAEQKRPEQQVSPVKHEVVASYRVTPKEQAWLPSLMSFSMALAAQREATGAALLMGLQTQHVDLVQYVDVQQAREQKEAGGPFECAWRVCLCSAVESFKEASSDPNSVSRVRRALESRGQLEGSIPAELEAAVRLHTTMTATEQLCWVLCLHVARAAAVPVFADMLSSAVAWGKTPDCTAAARRRTLQRMCADDQHSFAAALVAASVGHVHQLEQLAVVPARRVLVGTYKDTGGSGLAFDIAVRLDRNPCINAIELIFSTDKKTRIGYALIEAGWIEDVCEAETHTTSPPQYRRVLSLRGMSVEPAMRGKGVSKLFVATWLLLCFKWSAAPRTRQMDKPLIALVLTDFGLVPVSPQYGMMGPKATRSAVSPSPLTVEVGSAAAGGAQAGLACLWAPDLTRLHTAFSNRVLKSQNLCIVAQRPVASRTTHVRTCYGVSSVSDEAMVFAKCQELLEHNITFYSARLVAYLHHSFPAYPVPSSE